MKATDKPTQRSKPASKRTPSIQLVGPGVELAPRPEPGTRAWYEMQLADVEAALADAKPGEVASLHRRVMQYAEKISALRALETPVIELDHDAMVAKLTGEAALMADAYLEPFVREYCQRNRLTLVRA